MWCRRWDWNPRPRDYETLALPLSYTGTGKRYTRDAPRLPLTYGLRIENWHGGIERLNHLPHYRDLQTRICRRLDNERRLGIKSLSEGMVHKRLGRFPKA
jgi:hypothetical protein